MRTVLEAALERKSGEPDLEVVILVEIETSHIDETMMGDDCGRDKDNLDVCPDHTGGLIHDMPMRMQ